MAMPIYTHRKWGLASFLAFAVDWYWPLVCLRFLYYYLSFLSPLIHFFFFGKYLAEVNKCKFYGKPFVLTPPIV